MKPTEFPAIPPGKAGDLACSRTRPGKQDRCPHCGRLGAHEIAGGEPVQGGVEAVAKLLAAWLVFMLMWLPWWLFLIALRIVGGQPFDSWPLLSLCITLGFSGAALLGMGIFFSAFTGDKAYAALTTLGGMILLLTPSMFQAQLQTQPSGSVWVVLLRHVNYLGPLDRAADGLLLPESLLFSASLTVLWLFVTVQILAFRRLQPLTKLLSMLPGLSRRESPGK